MKGEGVKVGSISYKINRITSIFYMFFSSASFHTCDATFTNVCFLFVFQNLILYILFVSTVIDKNVKFLCQRLHFRPQKQITRTFCILTTKWKKEAISFNTSVERFMSLASDVITLFVFCINKFISKLQQIISRFSFKQNKDISDTLFQT